MRSVRGFTLIELLIVLAILGILIGLVAFNLDPILALAQERSMQSELGSVQHAIDSYNIVQVTSNGAAVIPARNVPAVIADTDGDAPFAVYLDDTTRYFYTWGEGGANLQVLAEVAALAADMSSAMTSAEAAVRDVISMSDTDNQRYGQGSKNWSRRLELLIEQGTVWPPDPSMDGTNVMGYVNPVSGKETVLSAWNLDPYVKKYQTPPAVLITNNGDYSFSHVYDSDDVANLYGALVIYRPDVKSKQDPSPIELFYVDENGKPQGLVIIE